MAQPGDDTRTLDTHRPRGPRPRRRRAVLATWLVATALVATSARAQAPAVGSGTQPLPASVTRMANHASMDGARLGLVVIGLPERQPLVVSHADDLFAPASVTKLFTTAAALWRLGAHFTWATPVAYNGTRTAGNIDGDLWVLGRGAPDLVEERLWIAAQQIAEQGVEIVLGDLVVDDRYFDDVRYAEGWPGGRQTSEAYHARVSALMANFAAMRVGNEWQAVDDPAIHFGERLRELLGRAGVRVVGTVRRPGAGELAAVPAADFAGDELGRRSVPSPLTALIDIRSEPLGRIVLDINKFSNNVMAETVLKALGAIEYGAPGTTTKGLAVVSRFLNGEVGIALNSYVQTDGSGLSDLNRFTPQHVSDLLLHAYDDFRIGPELLSSLKISGLDGWSPAPFRNAPLRGELRVKSGHINGVNTLSGFVRARSGRLLSFVAMVNDHRAQQWEIDQRMAELMLSLMREY